MSLELVLAAGDLGDPLFLSSFVLHIEFPHNFSSDESVK